MLPILPSGAHPVPFPQVWGITTMELWSSVPPTSLGYWTLPSGGGEPCLLSCCRLDLFF